MLKPYFNVVIVALPKHLYDLIEKVNIQSANRRVVSTKQTLTRGQATNSDSSRYN